ncbi:MAG TPA: EamA family transporter [Acidimicrobiaceae bacterium]|nr:EamA family transporter [Acidimicrobiaceae bacterium]
MGAHRHPVAGDEEPGRQHRAHCSTRCRGVHQRHRDGSACVAGSDGHRHQRRRLRADRSHPHRGRRLTSSDHTDREGRVAPAARPSRVAPAVSTGAAAAAPWLFVVLWSTGFVVARYGTKDAGPLTFLAIRLAIAALVLGGIAAATGSERPTRRQAVAAGVSGLGMHAVYLGGVFLAISWGMPSGIGALIAGLHPVITAVAARGLLHERLRRVQWAGVALGFAGVIVVVVDRLLAKSVGLTLGALLAAGLSVLGMSAGTLVQRRHGNSTPLLWGTATQYLVSSVALGLAATLHADEGFTPTARSLFALAWAVVVLSIAAVLIMLWLLQREAAAKVSSLFFLTPALSAIEGAILFGEQLGPLALIGLAIALAGVALTLRPAR